MRPITVANAPFGKESPPTRLLGECGHMIEHGTAARDHNVLLGSHKRSRQWEHPVAAQK